jgi:thioesterase domain-containing protein
MLQRDGLLRAAFDESDYRAIMDTFEHNARIMRTFVPQIFHGDALLFVASRGEAKPVDSWKAYVDGLIRVYPIDCTHDEMMAPRPAEQIGRVLAAEIGEPSGAETIDPKEEIRD